MIYIYVILYTYIYIYMYTYTSVHVINVYINNLKRYPRLQKTPGAKHLWWSICSIGVQSCLAPDSWKMRVRPSKHVPLKIGHPQKESCLPSINFPVRTGSVRDHYKWRDSFFGGNQASSKCIVLRHFPLNSDLVGLGWLMVVTFILAEWGFFLASVKKIRKDTKLSISTPTRKRTWNPRKSGFGRCFSLSNGRFSGSMLNSFLSEMHRRREINPAKIQGTAGLYFASYLLQIVIIYMMIYHFT